MCLSDINEGSEIDCKAGTSYASEKLSSNNSTDEAADVFLERWLPSGVRAALLDTVLEFATVLVAVVFAAVLLRVVGSVGERELPLNVHGSLCNSILN